MRLRFSIAVRGSHGKTTTDVDDCAGMEERDSSTAVLADGERSAATRGSAGEAAGAERDESDDRV